MRPGSPLDANLWLAELIGEKDEAFLKDGISHGFKLAPPQSKFFPTEQDNHKSATNADAKLAVEQAICNEIAEGNYIVTNDRPVIISALGVIPKPDSTEVHLIHDCSRPLGEGLNDYIQTQSFKFQTLDDAIKLLGANRFMAKIDLRHAYRSVPIHPSNFVETGLKWQFSGDSHFNYFDDRREIFHCFTQSVRQMLARHLRQLPFFSHFDRF